VNYFPNRLIKPTTAPTTRKVATDWQPVTRFTRASSNGKLIKCPHCGATHRTYHFSWIALSCSSCKAMVDKTDWSFKV
jgi:ribosomal protein S27E